LPLDGKEINLPYLPLTNENQKRCLSHYDYDTTYVHDYPLLFELTLKQLWKNYLTIKNKKFENNENNKIFKYVELILNDKLELVENNNNNNNNKFGMIVWKMTMKTPEYEDGRDIIVISNDITHESGSFGVMEDLIFHKASLLARKLKIPRIFITGNSGARIGLADVFKNIKN
jgi:acetyl-CoA carboxylase/biotin carboxylase 1